MTDTMTAEAPGELGQTFERRNEIRRMQTRFERWLPVLISSRTSRVVKQLESSKAMAMCRQFIADYFDDILAAKGHKSLTRFLSGEFTAGIKPIFVAKMVKGDVADIVECSTIIEVMEEKFDSGEWSVVVPEIVPLPVDPATKEFLTHAAEAMGITVEDGKVLKDGEQAGVVVETIVSTATPADQVDQLMRPELQAAADEMDKADLEDSVFNPINQAQLDKKVSALPPPMVRGGRRQPQRRR